MIKLLDIWIEQRDFLVSKSVEQLIAISGDGTLRDGNEASAQLRELFSNISASDISRYVDECLSKSFTNSGLILQDLINETGRRLGFKIRPGYYRGGTSRIGYDGIWTARDGYSFVIEVKTTDAYQLNLDTQAAYRERLVQEGQIEEKKSSILIVVGRRDTGGLEAQTRGSRHAWDVRIISVDALLKLMRVKENLTDSRTVSQIQEILKPLEYTRVDRLVDIIFTASEDLQNDDSEDEPLAEDHSKSTKEQAAPANFHEQSVNRISKYLSTPLIKQGRCTFTDAAQVVRVLCIVSKEYQRAGAIRYWYAFHPSHKEFLDEGTNSYVALGCGSADHIVLIPNSTFVSQLPQMRTTESNGRFYWHVEIFLKNGNYFLNKPTNEGLDVTSFLIPVANQAS